MLSIRKGYYGCKMERHEDAEKLSINRTVWKNKKNLSKKPEVEVDCRYRQHYIQKCRCVKYHQRGIAMHALRGRGEGGASE